MKSVSKPPVASTVVVQQSFALSGKAALGFGVVDFATGFQDIHHSIRLVTSEVLFGKQLSASMSFSAVTTEDQLLEALASPVSDEVVKRPKKVVIREPAQKHLVANKHSPIEFDEVGIHLHFFVRLDRVVD